MDIPTAHFAIVVIEMFFADLAIIAVIETTDNLDEPMKAGLAALVISTGLIWVATDVALIRIPIYSGLLMGPAGPFFALKDTRAPTWAKWMLYMIVFTTTVLAVWARLKG